MTEGAVVACKILAYRVFDAGDTIALDHVLAAVNGATHLVFGGPLVEGLLISARPVEIDLGVKTFHVDALTKELTAKVRVHLFDFGAVSLVYEIAVDDGTSLKNLTPFCDALYDSTELDRHATKLLHDVEKLVGTAIERPHPPIDPESFTIIFAREIKGISLKEVAAAEATAKLLLGETSSSALSTAMREDILKSAFSYLEDDLVIVDWNSALVVEPNGSLVVPHILELATCQLLEFRYYDSLLDRELTNVYELVENRSMRIFKSPYARLTRRVLKRLMELTEFTERVDNAIKSVGDVYLARVYSGALRRFRVPEWWESVESKLALVGRAYQLLKGDVESTRNQLLEVIVIVLILAELVAALRGIH